MAEESPNPADQIPQSIHDLQRPKRELDTQDSADWMQNFGLRYAHYGVIVGIDDIFSDQYTVDLYEGGYVIDGDPTVDPTRTGLTAHAMSAGDSFAIGDRVEVYLTQDDIGCWIRHPQVPDVFIVVCEGPDGQADFKDNYYWMARAYLSNKDSALPSRYVMYPPNSAHHLIVPVCNLFENNCKTHLVLPGTWGHVWWDWDQQTPPQRRWFTDVLDEGTCGKNPCSTSTSGSSSFSFSFSGSFSGTIPTGGQPCCRCYVFTIDGQQHILLKNGNSYFSQDGYSLEQTDNNYWILTKTDGTEVYYCTGPCPSTDHIRWITDIGKKHITDVKCCDGSIGSSHAPCCPPGYKIVTVLVSPVTKDSSGNLVFTIQDICVPDCPPNTRTIKIPCCSGGSSMFSMGSFTYTHTCYYLISAYYDCGSEIVSSPVVIDSDCGNTFNGPVGTWFFAYMSAGGRVGVMHYIVAGDPCTTMGDCPTSAATIPPAPTIEFCKRVCQCTNPTGSSTITIGSHDPPPDESGSGSPPGKYCFRKWECFFNCQTQKFETPHPVKPTSTEDQTACLENSSGVDDWHFDSSSPIMFNGIPKCRWWKWVNTGIGCPDSDSTCDHVAVGSPPAAPSNSDACSCPPGPYTPTVPSGGSTDGKPKYFQARICSDDELSGIWIIGVGGQFSFEHQGICYYVLSSDEGTPAPTDSTFTTGQVRVYPDCEDCERNQGPYYPVLSCGDPQQLTSLTVTSEVKRYMDTYGHYVFKYGVDGNCYVVDLSHTVDPHVVVTMNQIDQIWANCDLCGRPSGQFDLGGGVGGNNL